MSVNKAILVGRLGADPELRFTPSGGQVANFRIATNSVWKDRDGQRRETTDWHTIVVWGPQAEPCSKFLSKGREVFVEGEIRTRSYDDKDGNKRWVTEIRAQRVVFLGGGGGGGRGAPRDTDAPDTGEPAGGFGGPSDAGDDDIPF